MSARAQAADRDETAVLARAGIAPGAAAAFLSSRPRIGGDFGADCAAFSVYWQQAATLRTTLPAKLARNCRPGGRLRSDPAHGARSPRGVPRTPRRDALSQAHQWLQPLYPRRRPRLRGRGRSSRAGADRCGGAPGGSAAAEGHGRPRDRPGHPALPYLRARRVRAASLPCHAAAASGDLRASLRADRPRHDRFRRCGGVAPRPGLAGRDEASAFLERTRRHHPRRHRGGGRSRHSRSAQPPSQCCAAASSTIRNIPACFRPGST